MLTKTFISLVALFTLQASASVVTLVARSSLEILASRQTTGACETICAPFSSAVDTCTTKSCLCTAANTNALQDCINCAVTSSPTTAVISAAQSLIDTYKSTCAGVISPVLTVPANAPTTPAATTPVTTRVTSPIVITPTTSRTVVTAVTTTPILTQTVIGPSTAPTDSTDAATPPSGNLPTGITKSSSSKTGIQKTFVVAVGAMVGAALVL